MHNCTLLQKEIFLLTTCSHKTNWEKFLFPYQTLLYLYKKKNFWASPKWLLGFPNVSTPKICPIVSAHQLYNILHLKQNLIEHFYEEGPTWSLKNFFPRLGFRCYVLKFWRFKKTDVDLILCSLIFNHLYFGYAQTQLILK